MDAAKMTTEEIASLASRRLDRFGLIADVFSKESPENVVKDVVRQASRVCWEGHGSPEGTLALGLRSLSCGDMASFATQTRTEYARLFLGPRAPVAPLHESAYVSGACRMFTEETMAVRSFYERFGWVMKARNREPEDSIGTEFEFLRNLSVRCMELSFRPGGEEETRKLAEAQSEFLRIHVMRWAHEFARRVVENDRSGYYAAWARFLAEVLREEESVCA